ncbi:MULTISPECIES: hypothetical protein [unclassified Streptomyces]
MSCAVPPARVAKAARAAWQPGLLTLPGLSPLSAAVAAGRA